VVETAEKSIETFHLSRDQNTIYRYVLRRNGKKVCTRFRVNDIGHRTKYSQDFLAASVDAALLRSKRRPSLKRKGRTIRLADLFSGCGAMSLGVEEACRALGFQVRPILAIDFNQRAAELYNKNFPSAKTEVKDIKILLRGRLRGPLKPAERRLKKRLGRIDIAVAGPPCQGHSDLNNYTRRHDPKNGLYYRIVRFAKIIRPSHLIIENVPAVLRDRGRVIRRAKKALNLLGYHVTDHVIVLEDLGIPQSRRRHVLVASLTRRFEASDIISSYRHKKRSVKWAISDLLKVNPNGSMLDRWPAQTHTARRRIRFLFEHNSYNLPNRLRPPCHQSNNHTYKSVYGRLWWNRPAQTITSGFMCMGQGRFVHPKRRRTVTAREAARLQFIPDFFDFGENLGAAALAEIIGNAVPPKLTYVLTLELLR
jgi:DNA (cytosine-5)-methyltransferase 1